MRFVFVGLVCLPLASMAHARDFHFSYSPADLISPESLYTRLDESVTRHCREVNDVRNMRAVQACHRELLQMAVDEIGHPQLSAYVDSSRTSAKS